MPVYDYGFIQSDRPLTAAELARAQAQLGIGTSLDDLKEYYRQRYGRGGVLVAAGERAARPVATPLPLPAGQPVPQVRTLPIRAGEPMPRMQPLTTAGAVRQTALPAPAQVSPAISPAFQGTLTALEEYWQRTMPTYMPYAPGTPTFAREKWERERALTEQEKKLAAALDRTATFGKVVTKEDANILGVPVGTPTWEAANAAVERAHELRLASIRAAGGGSGGAGALPSTVSERRDYYRAQEMAKIDEAIAADVDWYELEDAIRQSASRYAQKGLSVDEMLRYALGRYEWELNAGRMAPRAPVGVSTDLWAQRPLPGEADKLARRRQQISEAKSRLATEFGWAPVAAEQVYGRL